MKKIEEKKKDKTILSVLTTVFLLVILGVSYASFAFSQSGKNLNTVTTGIMKMTYEESSNIINMTGALPTTDATGKVRLNDGEYFDFTVSSTLTGNVEINWEIAAEDFSSNTFDGSHVKLYLTSIDSNGKETEVMAPKVFTKDTSENAKTGRPSNMMSLATGTMSASTSTKYRLRMWVNEDYNPQGDGGGKKFAVRVNVYGKLSDDTSTGDDDTKVGQMKDDVDFSVLNEEVYPNVVRIVTQNTLTEPSNVTYSEDLSAAGDGSVMAYVDGDNVLTIAGNGTIRVGNTICFEGLTNVTSIDLTYLDTSQMEFADAMFAECSSLTDIDLSGLDFSNLTSMNAIFMESGLQNINLSGLDLANVTNFTDMFSGSAVVKVDLSNVSAPNWENMDYLFKDLTTLVSVNMANLDAPNLGSMAEMFSGCTHLTTVDLSNFNASNVTDMSYMFYYCAKLTNLNLTGFDTSSVMYVSKMFYYCTNLTTLDITSFDTSNVTDMSYMFYECQRLKGLDFSNFDTSKVTNMSYMFYNCMDLPTLDLTSFDTSKVTDMSYMFYESRRIAKISVSSKWKTASTHEKMFYGCGVFSVTYV